MEVQLTNPQSEFFNDKESRYIALVSGFGGGKTQTALTRMLANMMECPGLDQAYLAPSYPLIRDIWYPKVDEFMIEAGIDYRINKGENTIHVHNLGTIYCRTMDKPELIIGYEVGDAFLDEFDVLNIDKALHVFRKISARLRQKNKTGRPNQLFVTTTPEGFKATYQLFKKEPIKNSRLIQMSTYSNQHNLPEGYVEMLRDQYPAQLIEAYLMGQFINLESGSVYNLFNRDDNNCSTEIKDYEQLLVGMDFNVERACAVVAVKRNEKLHVVNEVFNAFDTRDMIRILKERYDNPISVYPDATGRSRKSVNATETDHILLKNAGFNIVTNETNPPIKERVNALNASFDKKDIMINVDLCPNLVETLEQQVWNQNGMPDKNGREDINDAIGYLAHKVFRVKRTPTLVRNRSERVRVGGY